MPLQAAGTDRFRYDGYELEPARARLTCRYSSGGRRFTERVTFDAGGDWEQPAVDAAARLVFLLAGVSYYKTTAAPVVDLGALATTEAERAFLRTFYVEGLGEFAFRNGLDLSGLEVTGPTSAGMASTDRAPAPFEPKADHPLVPFGGGIDSIVTVEHVRAAHPDTSLFVVSRSGDRFDAIEQAAAVTGLPVVRAGREIDPQLLRSAALGFLNGHVPVTGILSAIAVMAAVLGGHDAVVMSNERSASAATVVVDGRPVNHQWSKSLAFESAFRDQLARSLDGGPAYFSLLRACSELWVARRFADLPGYHPAFRSCNRAFTLDRDRRADEWCGTCDKCCFIDLVLAPFVAADALSAVFDGREPLRDAALTGRFRALVGSGPDAKPFECVGDVDECRAAVQLAAARPDRAGTSVLRTLAAEVGAGGIDTNEIDDAPADAGALLQPAGSHHVPDGYRLDLSSVDGPASANDPAPADAPAATA
jgi:UDP-N-acetyl-alpha-D-muramoyl-L-alanyl-L-glutamate epimerase